VYPVSPVASSGDSFAVRGTMTGEVSNVQVNGTPADMTSYADDGYWVAQLPIDYGDNVFSISYETDGQTFELDGHNISRRSTFSGFIQAIAKHPITGEYYAIANGENALIKFSNDGREADVIHQFYVKQVPNNLTDNDEPTERNPEGIWFSDDGAIIYLYVDHDGEDYIYSYDLALDTISAIYTPDSAGYLRTDQHYDFAPLLAPNRGSKGIVYFIPSNGSDGVFAFDLASNSMTQLTIPALASAVSASRAEYLAVGLKDDNTLVVLARKTNGATNYDYATEVDLSICDGVPAACSLAYANTVSTPTSDTDCPSADDNGVRSLYHQPSHSFIISNETQVCSYDIAANHISRATDKFDRYTEFRTGSDDPLLVDNSMIFSMSAEFDNRMARYPLEVDYTSRTQYPQLYGSSYVIGNALVQPRTPREVVVDEAGKRVFWIDRNRGDTVQAEIHVWHAEQNTWSNLGHYPDSSFENAVYSPEDDHLYVLNQGPSGSNLVYKINATSGEYSVLIGPTESTNTPNGLNFYTAAIAIDVEQQHLYLANAITHPIPVGFQPFNVLRWDLTNGGWTEIAELAPLDGGTPLTAYYHLEFDAQKNRLYFKRQSKNEVWYLDVATGERAVLSPDDDTFGPDLSNNRGAVIDPKNNRLIGTSQNHKSLFAIDLDSGVRSMISPKATAYGINFEQSKGIDLFSETQIAFVADERLDALYQVDLVTGQRAIMQNQARP